MRSIILIALLHVFQLPLNSQNNQQSKWDQQPPTNIDESKVMAYTLPDPLRRENGKRLKSVKAWEQKRRPEILSLFEQNQHGSAPSGSINIVNETVEQNELAMGGLARRTQGRITFPNKPDASPIRVTVNVPANATGPVPTLLHISFAPNVVLLGEEGIEEGMIWNTRTQTKIPDREAFPLRDIDPKHFIEKGYAVATVYYGDIEPDFDHGGKHGVRAMFEDNSQRPDRWGAIGAWAWGMSRVMDYLETVPEVDAEQVALSGVSRIGKAVIWAAAKDPRFAMAIPMVSGEGGAAISRRNYGETVADLTNPSRFDYWYAPKYADYAFQVEDLPVDGHMLLALIAPRPVLQIVGSEDTWSDPKGEWVAAKAASEVFELYGKKSLKGEEMPEAGDHIYNDMGFFVHDGGHGVFPEDYEAMTNFMDLHFTNQAVPAKVTVTEDDTSFTLSNGIVTAKVSKESGDLTSLVYKGVETLTDVSGHPYVYWSHDVKGGEKIVSSITIDPATNNGEMAEVSVKGISGGTPMGHGPGAPPEGDLPIDIEIRYTLAQAEQGVYTYCIFEHLPEYGAGDFSEARVAAKLQPFFDYMHIDDSRSGTYPLFDKNTADKYVYTTLQADNRAYGFSSPERGLGWFMIIPSAEFLSGGPTKAEFLAHGLNPTVLSYWRSSHYSGASIALDDGEAWTRVVGPILLYVNEGKDPEAMWNNAKKKLKEEEESWPYDWVKNAPYVPREKRSEVSGRIVIEDSISSAKLGSNRQVFLGLTKTPYPLAGSEGKDTIHWPNDAKNNQYWVKINERDGSFSIPHVPAGEYTLHVFADGVLGEYMQQGIEVPEGAELDLGEIQWEPIRHGRQLWEIGLANRTATEFAGGDSYFEPGSALRYAEQFPDDIDFEIGKSDFSEDWYYAHMPHANDSTSRILPFRGVSGNGKAAPRKIRFNLDKPVSGEATLRIAVSGTGANPKADFSVNGNQITQVDFGRNDGALVRHQVHGIWREVEIPFDASLLKQGENTFTLTVPAGPLNNGIIYDYLRLEIAE